MTLEGEENHVGLKLCWTHNLLVYVNLLEDDIYTNKAQKI
jgi:hypothetical protein